MTPFRRPHKATWRLAFFASHGALAITLHVALLDLLPLIVQFAASAHAQKKFGAALFEVQLERHQRQALLVRLAGELTNFATVQQQFSRATWLMIEPVCLSVDRKSTRLNSSHLGISY